MHVSLKNQYSFRILNLRFFACNNISIVLFNFPELREETVEVLLSTASLLQLTTVTTACCTFLKKQLDPCNCLGIGLFAEQQSCLALHKSALEYTYQHFMQVFCTALYQEFGNVKILLIISCNIILVILLTCQTV